jgi:hypothetical protein
MDFIRYTGTTELRFEDETGLRAYFSPGAQLAVGEHNRALADELLATGEFEVVTAGEAVTEVTAGTRVPPDADGGVGPAPGGEA